MVTNSKYKTILFDWDGTLAQTIPVWEEAFRTVFNTLHMPININEATQKLWIDSQILTELGIEHDGFFDLVYEQLNSTFSQTKLYPGVGQMLESLKKNDLKMALVSSTRRPQILQAIRFHHLEPYFECIVAGGDVSNHKPDPEPYEKALTQLNSAKENALIIGDSKFDLIGAKNTCVDCALFFPKENEKYYDEEELRSLDPNYIVKEYTELIDLIINNSN